MFSVQGSALGLRLDNKFTGWAQVGSRGEVFGIGPVNGGGTELQKKGKKQ